MRPTDGADETPPVAEAAPLRDLFCRGTIVRLSRDAESGAVRTANGREIPFDLQYVTVLSGPPRELDRCAIQIGMEVGYDLGWTSRGLRVTKLFSVGRP